MLLRHISCILPVIMCLEQHYAYSYPRVNQGQTRILALVWGRSICSLGERWKGPTPPAWSPQGGKGWRWHSAQRQRWPPLPSTASGTEETQDPAERAQLRCKQKPRGRAQGPLSGRSSAMLSPLREHPARPARNALLLTKSPARRISSTLLCCLPGRGTGERGKHRRRFCDGGSPPGFTRAPVPTGELLGESTATGACATRVLSSHEISQETPGTATSLRICRDARDCGSPAPRPAARTPARLSSTPSPRSVPASPPPARAARPGRGRPGRGGTGPGPGPRWATAAPRSPPPGGRPAARHTSPCSAGCCRRKSRSGWGSPPGRGCPRSPRSAPRPLPPPGSFG